MTADLVDGAVVVAVPVWQVVVACLVLAGWLELRRRGVLVTVSLWPFDGDTPRVVNPRLVLPVRIEGIEAPAAKSFMGRLSTLRMWLWMFPGWPVVVVRTGSSHGRWVGRVYQPFSVAWLQRLTLGAVKWDIRKSKRSPLRGLRRVLGRPG